MSHQAHPIKASIHAIEGASRIRTKSVRLAKPNGSKEVENPEIFLWAGPRSLFISADLRGIDLDDLQISVKGTCLIFHGYFRSDLPPERGGIHQAKKTPETFSHVLELPYEVNVDQAEVLNENGLISIILKRMEPCQSNDRVAQSSLTDFRRRFWGENGDSSNKLKDEIMILETLERYLEYQAGKGSSDKGG